MEKIILSKRQAAALELLIKESDLENDIDLVLVKNSNNRVWQRKELTPLNELSYKEILKALYVGYKVAETKEEIILYSYKLKTDDISYDLAYNAGMYDTLNILGIKIEGVNK